MPLLLVYVIQWLIWETHYAHYLPKFSHIFDKTKIQPKIWHEPFSSPAFQWNRYSLCLSAPCRQKFGLKTMAGVPLQEAPVRQKSCYYCWTQNTLKPLKKYHSLRTLSCTLIVNFIVQFSNNKDSHGTTMTMCFETPPCSKCPNSIVL